MRRPKPVWLKRVIKRGPSASRLHRGIHIVGVHLDDALKTARVEEDRRLAPRDVAARVRQAAAARHDGKPCVRYAHNRARKFLARTWPNGERRDGAGKEQVLREMRARVEVGEHVFRAHDVRQGPREILGRLVFRLTNHPCSPFLAPPC